MKNNSLDYKILHNCIFYLLKCISEYCNENDLKYCIDFGTLLGAMRNNRIIPWDDDGDICMPREDFDKFVETFNQNNKNKNICLQYYNTDEKHNVPWCRLRLKGTTCLSEYHRRCGFKEKGVWVGVFPYDHSCTNNKKMLLKRLKFLKIWQRIYSNHNSDRKTFKAKLFFLLTFFLSKRIILRKEKKIMCMYDVKGKNKFFIHSFISPKNKIYVFDDDVFSKRKTILLEGTEFYVPTDPDKHLKAIYGSDYLIPPPKKDRYQHDIIEFKVDEKIKKILYEK